MSDTTVTGTNGAILHLKEMGGRLYPPFDHLQNVAAIKARPDDVMLCAYPKSGTHWVHEMIRYLIAGTTDLPLAEKDDNMIEAAEMASLEAVPSPRVLNTHFHFENISPEFLRNKCKTIFLIRDPRDVAVSYYNHHVNSKEFYQFEGQFKDYFDLFIDGKMDYDSWFEYTKGWEKGMKDRPDHPFLVLAYEAMKEDPLKTIKSLAHFLGIERSEDFMNQVVEKTSFGVMKKQREAVEGHPLTFMYRKGQKGDWKNWFTVAQSEYFDAKLEEEMKATDAYKRYSHSH